MAWCCATEEPEGLGDTRVAEAIYRHVRVVLPALVHQTRGVHGRAASRRHERGERHRCAVRAS